MATPKITLKKIFHDTFSSLMLSNGFKRYKQGYVRMYGAGILQAITLASFSPNFVIRYACHPYWIFQLREGQSDELNKDYWMEEWCLCYFNGEPIPSCHYFKDQPESSYDDMKLWLKITEEKILPDLNKIQTIDDYVNYVIDCAGRLDTPRGTPRINQYILLYKSYLEHSFDSSLQYINEHRSYLAEMEGYSDRDAWIKDIDERIIPFTFGVFLQKMEENDLEWITEFREKKCAEMRQQIHDVLKIDFD